MLTRVLIHNFRGLIEADLRLTQPVTLILGNEGAGKTSLAEGIIYGLAGACRYTDAGGRGAEVLVKSGQARIDLAGDTLPTVSRTIGKTNTLIADDREGKEAQALLDSGLPRRELLLAMLRTDGLIGLPAKEQQDLLFTLAGGETGSEWFRERLEADEQEILSDVLATLLKGSALSDKLHKTAYDLRTGANSLAKDAKGKLSTETIAAPTAAQLAAAEQELAEARTRAGDLREQIGAARAAASSQTAAQAQLAQAQADVAAAEQALATLGDKPAPPTDAEVAVAETAITTSRTDYADAINLAAEANAKRQALQDQADGVKAADGKCSLSPSVECPLTKAQIGSIINGLQKQADALEKDIAFYQGKATEVTAVGDAAVTLQVRLRQQREAAVRWEQEHATVTRAHEQAKSRLAYATPAAGDAPDVTALESQLLTVADQEQQAAATLADLQEQQRASVRQTEAVAAAEKAQARAATLDALVKKLSPDGLPAQAMRETIGSVIGAINEVLVEFTDFQLSAEPGKEFVLNASGVGADGKPYETPVWCLSEGEQLRVGAAIQVALAKLTGFGFVIIDGVNKCGPENRALLLGMLLESGVQALVLLIPSNGQIPQAEGLDVWRLEAGVLAEAVAEVAA